LSSSSTGLLNRYLPKVDNKYNLLCCLLVSHNLHTLQSSCLSAANIQAIYTYNDDAVLITERLSATFLQQLQQQLATSSNNPQLVKLDIQPFVRVARDVLSYLRYSNSQALLPLLRQYSSSGTMDVAEIDPDVLQGDVLQLLNVTQLSQWYSAASQYDVPGSRTVPPPPVAAAAAGTQESGQVSEHWKEFNHMTC
jgi:hypothetical protein